MPEEPEGEHRVVDHDHFDDLVWRDTLGECQPLRDLRVSGRKIHPGFGGLLADLHAGLYKPDPHLVDDVPPQAGWQRSAVEKSWEGAEWGQTRETSVLDEMLSAIGTMAAGAAALEELKKAARPEGATPGSAAPPEVTPQQTRMIARAAAKAAKQEVADAEAVLASWGLDPGALQHLPLGKRVELAQKLAKTAKLRQMADIVGEMRSLASGLHQRRVTAKPSEVVGVETGSDLRRLLPSELAMLAHPQLRYEAVRRLMTGQSLQWQKATREKQGRGPLVVCCDTSNSTAGQVEMMIKGVAMGLLEIARRQGRNFAGVVFSSRAQIETFEFRDGKVDPEALLEFATLFFNGGTDWEAPLTEALRLQQQSPYRNGDIVLITDGICALSPEFTAALAEEKERRKVHLVGVLVGSDRSDTMQFCDAVIQTSDLARVAADILATVVEDPGAA